MWGPAPERGGDSESCFKNLWVQNQGELSILILGNSDLDPFSSNFKHVNVSELGISSP